MSEGFRTSDNVSVGLNNFISQVCSIFKINKACFFFIKSKEASLLSSFNFSIEESNYFSQRLSSSTREDDTWKYNEDCYQSISNGEIIFLFKIPNLELSDTFFFFIQIFISQFLNPKLSVEKLNSSPNSLLQPAAESLKKYPLKNTSFSEALFKKSQKGVAFLKENRFVKVNRIFAEFWGYEPDELIQHKSPQELYDFPFLKNGIRTFEKVEIKDEKGNEKRANFEYIYLKKEDSNCVIILIDSIKIKKESEWGTDREHIYRKIIETSLDSMIAVSAKGKVIDSNSTTTIMFGYHENSMKRLNIFDLILFEGRDEEEDLSFLVNENNDLKVNRFETLGKFNDKGTFDIEVSISFIKKDIKSNIFSFVIRDISETKASEKALKAAIIRADAARAQEQRFLSNMSHEIRTPMNAIIGMAHLLKESGLNDIQEEYLNALSFSSNSLLGVLNNVLDLSKIESGQIIFEKILFNLKEVLENVVKKLKYQVAERPIKIHLNFDDSIQSMLLGDVNKLNQILDNITNNAIKFTIKGEINISVKVISEIANRLIVQFIVQDTGIGIKPSKVNTIFENFQQANIESNRQYGGSGLGLSIVKRLINFQNGSIILESTPSVGSSFIFTLPFTKSMEKAVFSNNVTLKSEKNLKQEFAKLTILVVEDNYMNQKLISRVLYNLGIKYEVANNGQEALELSKIKKYDLIFMDIHMPIMNGYEVTNAIKKDPVNLNFKTKIIALTAAAVEQEKKKALANGMIDYVTKPFTPIQIKNVIKRWFFDAESLDNLPAYQVDFSFLEKISDKNGDFVVEIINIFLRDVPKGLKDMYAAKEKDDYNEVLRIAHSLKSNFLAMGMTELSLKAKKIESDLSSENPEYASLDKRIKEIVEGHARYLPFLRSKLEEYNQ